MDNKQFQIGGFFVGGLRMHILFLILLWVILSALAAGFGG